MSIGCVVLALLIYILAAARVTRVITDDLIFNPVRLALANRMHDTDLSEGERRRWKLAWEGSRCAFCVSFWLTLASAYGLVYLVGWPAWTLVPVALATSYIVGFLAGVLARFAEPDELVIESVDTPNE